MSQKSGEVELMSRDMAVWWRSGVVWCGGVAGGVRNNGLQPFGVGEDLGPLKINMCECGWWVFKEP